MEISWLAGSSTRLSLDLATPWVHGRALFFPGRMPAPSRLGRAVGTPHDRASLAVLIVHALMRWRIAFVLLAGSYRCTHLENRSPLVCPWWASRRPRGSRISAEQIIADRRTSSLMDDSSAYANNNRRTQNPRTGRCAEKPAQQRSTQTIPDSRQI